MFRIELYVCGLNEPLREVIMPILLWLLGVPVVVIIALMLTHVI